MNGIKEVTGATPVELFADALAYFGVVDIGFIKNVSADGTAHVVSCTPVGDQLITYEHAEIIYPGSDKGAFATLDIGSMCLILIPRACVPDLASKKVAISKEMYSSEGVKALPITTGTHTISNLTFDEEGNLTMQSPTYNFTFAQDCISFTLQEYLRAKLYSSGDMVLSSGKKGQQQVRIQNDSSGRLHTYTSSDGTRTLTCTVAADGSFSIVQSNTSNASAPSTLALVNVSAQGDISFNNNTITISMPQTPGNNSAAFSLTQKSGNKDVNTISLNSDGALSIANRMGTALQDVDIDIKAGGKVSITSAEMTINNHLKVLK